MAIDLTAILQPGETIVYLILGGCLADALLAVLVIARWAQRHHPDDLAITDRRVLLANSDWDNKLESLTLNEIDRVAWVAMVGFRQLTVEGGGRTIKLPPLCDGDAAAKAIAEAAGLAPPPALGRFAAVDPVMFGFVLAKFTAYLALNQALISCGPTEGGGPLYGRRLRYVAC